MELHPSQYYHIYNRSINYELTFRSDDNYRYFLKKYQNYFEEDFYTIAYCLMPTHFHFLVHVNTEDIAKAKNNMGILLSSYTKAFNLQYKRHGSLFQQHTKSRRVDKDSYLITLMTYIHQNPVRANLVEKLEDWDFSSYQDYIGIRKDPFVKLDLLLNHFSSVEEFKIYSNEILKNIDPKYWI